MEWSRVSGVEWSRLERIGSNSCTWKEGKGSPPWSSLAQKRRKCLGHRTRRDLVLCRLPVLFFTLLEEYR